MKSILCCIPNTADGTSFYRGCGPLSLLRKTKDVNLIFANPITWATVSMCDMAFLQRPFAPEHLQIAQMVKDCKRPLWVDYDDFLLGVPDDNPVHTLYMNKGVQATIGRILGMADVITVSTQRLKDLYSAIFREVTGKDLPGKFYVVPNAFNTDLLEFDPKPKDHKLVCWRGTNTHQADLACYAGEIIEVAATHTDWTFNFVGYNPWFITRVLPKKQCIVTEALDILEYFRFMRITKPAIQVVPLDSSEFNHCKSNIAWLESAACGTVTLAPDWPEWRRPGVVTYKDNDSFKVGLEYLMGLSFEDRAALNSLSAEHIQKKLLLPHVNKTREQIVEALCGTATFPDGGEASKAELPKAEEGMELE